MIKIKINCKCVYIDCNAIINSPIIASKMCIKSEIKTATVVALLTKLVASMFKWQISSTVIALRVCFY